MYSSASRTPIAMRMARSCGSCLRPESGAAVAHRTTPSPCKCASAFRRRRRASPWDDSSFSPMPASRWNRSKRIGSASMSGCGIFSATTRLSRDRRREKSTPFRCAQPVPQYGKNRVAYQLRRCQESPWWRLAPWLTLLYSIRYAAPLQEFRKNALALPRGKL